MSIGDLFGNDLKVLFGELQTSDDLAEVDPLSGGEPNGDGSDSPEANSSQYEHAQKKDTAATFVSVAGQLSGEPRDAEQAVRSILAELSGLNPESIDFDASLEDLGATGLGLWAVVAEVERQTGQEFADSTVVIWKTPRDIVAPKA